MSKNQEKMSKFLRMHHKINKSHCDCLFDIFMRRKIEQSKASGTNSKSNVMTKRKTESTKLCASCVFPWYPNFIIISSQITRVYMLYRFHNSNLNINSIFAPFQRFISNLPVNVMYCISNVH